jgi:hypothetical protein
MRRAFSIMGMAAAQAAVLAAAACGPAPDGSDPAVPRPAPTEVTSLTVVEGHVTDTSGKPVAGADVYAQLWPSEHVESSLKVGDTVPMHRIGIVSTGADGRFAFTLDPATVPVNFRSGTGEGAYVQLEVLVAGNQGSAAWNLTAYTAMPWATPETGTADPVWTLSTDQDNLPPPRVDVVLVLNGQSHVRTD